jgi:protein-tyrosine phosphatase
MIRKLINWLQGPQPTNFVEIPLPTPGKLFVSPMPFGPYDPHHNVFKDLQTHKVTTVLSMVTDEEVAKKCKKRNLFHFYEQNGMNNLRIPFQDLSAPPLESVSETVPLLVKELKDGNNCSIHCNAGVGRTGILAACISSYVLHIDGDKAIAHIREQMMVNLTDEQKRIIYKWADINLNSK